MTTTNDNANALAPGHNPAGLLNSQVPPGHRLLDPDEVGPEFKACGPLHEIKRWTGERFSDDCWIGCGDDDTYCTTFTRAELRAARGLPPEEPVKTAPTPDAPVLMRDMTLLDWFAGQVIAGLMSCENVSLDNQVVAKYSYDIAEAMLAERKRRAGK